VNSCEGFVRYWIPNWKKSSVEVATISSGIAKSTHALDTEIKSRTSDLQEMTPFQILHRITDKVLQAVHDASPLDYLPSRPLADDGWMNLGDVDILLGGDIV